LKSLTWCPYGIKTLSVRVVDETLLQKRIDKTSHTEVWGGEGKGKRKACNMAGAFV
jgi:hypothetical protein